MTLVRSAASASVAYFGVVMAAGFALGVVRVGWLVSRLGVRTAELLELPLMLGVVVAAARWINRRFLAASSQLERLMVGLAALGLLVIAELALALALGGRTPREALLDRDPISGTAYALSLCAFGLMPWALARPRAAS